MDHRDSSVSLGYPDVTWFLIEKQVRFRTWGEHTYLYYLEYTVVPYSWNRTLRFYFLPKIPPLFPTLNGAWVINGARFYFVNIMQSQIPHLSICKHMASQNPLSIGKGTFIRQYGNHLLACSIECTKSEDNNHRCQQVRYCCQRWTHHLPFATCHILLLMYPSFTWCEVVTYNLKHTYLTCVHSGKWMGILVTPLGSICQVLFSLRLCEPPRL